jgi:hypothetical protein
VTGSSLDILPTTTDRANEDDEVDEEDANADDEIDEDYPTGRARMCCRSKPTGKQR